MAAPEPSDQPDRVSDPSIVRFRALVEAGLAALEARREEVNDLNVFPVADGDTGDNMVLTLRAVLQELDRLADASEGRTIDDIGRDEIVASVARAALLGARGNSGVILSQLIRGAAEELASRPGELVDPVLIGAALARAADQAYGSVRDPAEGTILTVVREMAHRVASELAHMPDARLGPEASAEEQDAVIAEVIERALEAGQESVSRGPDLLPVLREAGVVDAGGYALTVLLAGIVGALRGSDAAGARASRRRARHPSPARLDAPIATARTSPSPAPASSRAGSSPSSSSSATRCWSSATRRRSRSTSTPTIPNAATALFAGRRRRLAPRRGRHARAGPGSATSGSWRRAAPAVCGALAVVNGDGMRALFESFGVRVLDGGPTLNPSTYDLLAAIHAVPAEEVVVLPNSANVVMAAERAAELSDKTVAVVPSRSQQAGLAAAVSLDPTRGAPPTTPRRWLETLERVRTGAVAPAARDDAQGRFRAGDAVGFVEERDRRLGRAARDAARRARRSWPRTPS